MNIGIFTEEGDIGHLAQDLYVGILLEDAVCFALQIGPLVAHQGLQPHLGILNYVKLIFLFLKRFKY